MIFLPRLLPFLCLLMLLPRFSHGSPSSLSPVLIMVLMSTFSGAHAVNKCLTSGEYLKISQSGPSVTNAPENGTLKEVGDKYCAFRITGQIQIGRCTSDYTVEFDAVELTEKTGSFCSFWFDHAVCVCDSFGCNFATGMLYETALYSYINWINGTGKIVGEDYAAANLIPKQNSADSIIDCLLDDLQKVYSIPAFIRATGDKFRDDFNFLRVTVKDRFPQLFPSNASLAKLTQENTVVNPPTTTMTPALAAAAAAAAAGGNDSSSGVPVTYVIGGVLGVLLLIVIVIFIIFFVRNRSKRAMKKGAKRGVAALAEQENILQAMKNSHKAVKEKLKEAKIELHQGDREALRYHDVPCIEATRVKCKGGEFVHANHFTACDGKKFIAFQGPLPSTIEQTWIMLKEQECKAIVMLCLFKEKKTKTSTEYNDKCGPYFPENEEEKATFGSVTVTCLSTVRVPLIGVVQRKLQIDVEGQPPFIVEHLQYMNWVDHGCPPEPHQISELKELVDGMETSGPLGVHCSAGVGRTGTFIGLYEGMAMLKEDHKFDTEMVMTRLREARASMVQHDTQFVMLTVVLVEIMAEKGIIPRDKNYDKIMAAWEEQKRESELQPSH